MNLLLFVVKYYLIIWLGAIGGSLCVRVTIKNGTLEGLKLQTRKGREIAAFKSIPYALPPIGELRFEPPQPSDSWPGIRAATANVPSCIQATNEPYNYNPEGVYSEDCLYLNVYTPEVKKFTTSQDEEKIYPVAIWIHGGGFYSGSSHSVLYGPEFLLDYDLVLVTINYRVGAFGYLSTSNSAAYGNQGFKDQVQALRWVQENIINFGGDPNNVTIIGQSAGGASVHYLMISSLTEGLFHRAISDSGTSLGPWAFDTAEAAQEQVSLLAVALNCTEDRENFFDVVACLKQQDPEQFVEADAKRIANDDTRPFYRPVVEPEHPGAFLTENPLEALRKGNFAKVPWISGINAQEGSALVAGLYGQGESAVQSFDTSFLQIAPSFLLFDQECSPECQESIAKKIRRFYFGNKHIDESTRFNDIDMVSDAWIIASSVAAVKESLKATDYPLYYYFYFFNFESNWSWSEVLGDPTRDYGVCHADELQYVFPLRKAKAPNVPYREEDFEMVNLLTTLWFNFIATGVPTPSATKLLPVTWERVQTEALEQLVINSPTDLRMTENVLPERISFWENLPCNAGITPLTKDV